MQNAAYYRQQAARARRLVRSINDPQATEALLRIAEDFDDIAVGLERGAIDVRHPSRMPQAQQTQ